MTECLPGLLFLFATLRHKALRRRYVERTLARYISNRRAFGVARLIP